MTTPDTSDGWTYINFDESTGSYPPRPENADPERTVYRGPVQPTDCMDGDRWWDTTANSSPDPDPEPLTISEIEDRAKYGWLVDAKEVLRLIGQIRENELDQLRPYSHETVRAIADERDQLADENRQLRQALINFRDRWNADCSHGFPTSRWPLVMNDLLTSLDGDLANIDFDEVQP